MKRAIFLLLLTAFVLSGCAQTSQEPAKAEDAVETPTPSPTSTETPKPTPEPTEVPKEEPEDEDTGDAFADFTRKIAGVWGTDDAFFIPLRVIHLSVDGGSLMRFRTRL